MFQPETNLVNARRRLTSAILLSGALVSLAPLAALAWYAFPSADDYCYAVEARTGWWHQQTDTYLSITGRYTSTLLLGALSRWDLASVYPWFCLATLAATFLAFRGLIRAAVGGAVPGLHLTAAAATATAVFVGMLPSSVEAFFWMSSSVTYQWGIVTYLVWLTLLIRIASATTGASLGLRAAAVALTVLLPGFNEVLMPVVLVTITGFVVASRRERSTCDAFMLGLLGVAALFTAVSLAAPGNVNRSHGYPDIPTRHDLGFALAETARQTWRFLGRYSSHAALWVAACGAWWWGRRVFARAIEVTGGSTRTGASVLGLAGLVYLTLFPLYWEYGEVNYSGEGRTYNVTYLVFCATIVMGAGVVLSTISGRLTMRGIRLPKGRPAVDLLLAAALAILMAVSPGVLQAFRAVRLAPDYLEIQQARESTLRASENRGRAVLVNEVRVRPAGLFWGDIQPDETHWINTCVAAYYDLDSVRTPR